MTQHGTQDDADLNTTQWRLVDAAARSGYAWWLQEDSTTHVVIARDVEHPYSERTLLVYRSGRSTTVFLASSDGMKRITQREAFSLLSHQSL